jgi:hypothetical protein
MNPAMRPSSSTNFPRYLGQLLLLLLGWAAASIAVGASLRRTQDKRLSGVADQFIAWGAVDGLIAAAGIAGTRQDSRRVELGLLDQPGQARQARRFEWVVWVNALLDIGYVAGGTALARRSASNPYRRGSGLGIIIQGAFLFIWDIFLALSIRKYRRDRLA